MLDACTLTLDHDLASHPGQLPECYDQTFSSSEASDVSPAAAE